MVLCLFEEEPFELAIDAVGVLRRGVVADKVLLWVHVGGGI
jgi:hypothetical protein